MLGCDLIKCHCHGVGIVSAPAAVVAKPGSDC